MIRSVEEGIMFYKSELKRYYDYTETVKRSYPPDRDFLSYDREHYDKIRLWNAELRGMIRILGLTKKEETEIDLEIGIVS